MWDGFNKILVAIYVRQYDISFEHVRLCFEGLVSPDSVCSDEQHWQRCVTRLCSGALKRSSTETTSGRRVLFFCNVVKKMELAMSYWLVWTWVAVLAAFGELDPKFLDSSRVFDAGSSQAAKSLHQHQSIRLRCQQGLDILVWGHKKKNLITFTSVQHLSQTAWCQTNKRNLTAQTHLSGVSYKLLHHFPTQSTPWPFMPSVFPCSIIQTFPLICHHPVSS